MATIYNDDARTLGYWFDENNGINNMHGIFKIMTILEETGYTAELGNPITIWKMPVPDTETYKGLDYPELDYMYLARSSFKWVREYYLKRWVNRSTQPRIEAVKDITRMYSKKWLDLWETMFYEFDPIENYNMIEQMIDDEKVTEYGRTEETENDLTHLKTGSEVDTPGVTTTETDQIYGFGSDDNEPVNSNKRITRPTGTDTHQYNNISDKDTGTQTVSNSGTDTETRNYRLTRSGNIGVTTSQQMIEQQRKLVMYNYFDNVVFPDIDKILTLSVY